jgi:hypothetical protein
MYLYHADALALGGNLIRPLQNVVSSQAACSLPPSGGVASSRVDKFSMNGLVSFDSAQSDLAGGTETKGGKQYSVTRVSVVVENLNVLNMVMADRIVMRLAAEHEDGAAEPSIITTGSHYDGLRIAGHAVEVTTGHDLFSSMPTFDHFQNAWKKNIAGKKKIMSSLMGSTLPAAPAKDAPQHLHDVHNGCQQQCKAPDIKQTMLSSFVTKVAGISGSEINCWGPIIVVPQFGTIYLGEVMVSHGQRRVNMLRLELGSPDGGNFSFGSGGSNGSPYPPV